ncbi:hypothetical protein ACQ3VH_05845 [Bacillus pretiosus]
MVSIRAHSHSVGGGNDKKIERR